MKKTTKLFASFLVLGALFALSLSLVSALGYPYEFRIGTQVELEGEFFEIDGTQFAENAGSIFVYLDGEWYFIQPGDYALVTSPWAETVQILSDHDCYLDGSMHVCAGNSGGGGGMG